MWTVGTNRFPFTHTHHVHCPVYVYQFYTNTSSMYYHLISSCEIITSHRASAVRAGGGDQTQSWPLCGSEHPPGRGLGAPRILRRAMALVLSVHGRTLFRMPKRFYCSSGLLTAGGRDGENNYATYFSHPFTWHTRTPYRCP